MQPGFAGHWKGLTPQYSFEPVETGVAYETLASGSPTRSSTRPAGLHRQPQDRADLLRRGARRSRPSGPVDWAFAEALAFGSLLLEGTPVRLSGQDSRRGTFSQRHAVLVDCQTGEPLHPAEPPARRARPSSASTTACCPRRRCSGFDYGYSLDEPHMLIIWEAQFGDFANGAQVIIDQFIASAESKWGRASGLVMLLPHGYEGQGPEHSSARLERFLQLCAEDNIQVVVPVDAGAVLPPAAPAGAAQLPQAAGRDDAQEPAAPQGWPSRRSSDLASGRFHEVLDDRPATPDRVAPGRALLQRQGLLRPGRQARGAARSRDVAIVRLEQLYPWPADALKARSWAATARPASGSGCRRSRRTWAAGRSSRRGSSELMGVPFQYVGRDASASPATGSHHVHDREQAELVEAAIGAGGAAPGLGRDPAGRRPAVAARRARSELTMAAVPITVPGVGESITEGDPGPLAQARRLGRQGRRAALRARDRQGEQRRPRPGLRRPRRSTSPKATTVAIGADRRHDRPRRQPARPPPRPAPAAASSGAPPPPRPASRRRRRRPARRRGEPRRRPPTAASTSPRSPGRAPDRRRGATSTRARSRRPARRPAHQGRRAWPTWRRRPAAAAARRRPPAPAAPARRAAAARPARPASG